MTTVAVIMLLVIAAAWVLWWRTRRLDRRLHAAWRAGRIPAADPLDVRSLVQG